MPTSTRRQAASRNQRYSEVSAGALSDDLAGAEAHHDDPEEDLDVQEYDEQETINDDDEADPNEGYLGWEEAQGSSCKSPGADNTG